VVSNLIAQACAIFTIKELALKVIKLTGSGSSLIFNELSSNDLSQRQPDISQAKERPVWKPNTELEARLRNTIGYFETPLSAQL
jgi:UDP-glucuronate decarboxylase